MLDTSLEFPFEYDQIIGLGKLFYPIVKLPVLTIDGWVNFKFLVDTGADITTIPDILLPAFGIDKHTLKVSNTFGVGGFSVKTWDLILELKFGKDNLKIMASAVETKNKFTPLLLGRKDIFEEKFSLLLDSKHKKTVIYKN
jgi:hypothetical protein